MQLRIVVERQCERDVANFAPVQRQQHDRLVSTDEYETVGFERIIDGGGGFRREDAHAAMTQGNRDVC